MTQRKKSAPKKKETTALTIQHQRMDKKSIAADASALAEKALKDSTEIQTVCIAKYLQEFGKSVYDELKENIKGKHEYNGFKVSTRITKTGAVNQKPSAEMKKLQKQIEKKKAELNLLEERYALEVKKELLNGNGSQGIKTGITVSFPKPE